MKYGAKGKMKDAKVITIKNGRSATCVIRGLILWQKNKTCPLEKLCGEGVPMKQYLGNITEARNFRGGFR